MFLYQSGVLTKLGKRDIFNGKATTQPQGRQMTPGPYNSAFKYYGFFLLEEIS